jgi:hypothetical protein
MSNENDNGAAAAHGEWQRRSQNTGQRSHGVAAGSCPIAEAVTDGARITWEQANLEN